MNDYGQRITAEGEDFRAADRLEILDLVSRFTLASDIGDREMFAGCFTDPMNWDLSNNPAPLTGGPADQGEVTMARAEFVDRAFGAVGAKPTRERFTQHIVANASITFTTDADATVLAHLYNPFHTKMESGEGQTASDRIISGLYHIDTVLTRGRWRIATLRLALYGYDPRHFRRGG